MTKRKSIVLSIALMIWAFSLVGMNQLIPALVVSCISLLCFLIWLYKSIRDERIIAQAQQAQETLATPTEPTSKGNRLFVPLPINK